MQILAFICLLYIEYGMPTHFGTPSPQERGSICPTLPRVLDPNQAKYTISTAKKSAGLENRPWRFRIWPSKKCRSPLPPGAKCTSRGQFWVIAQGRGRYHKKINIFGFTIKSLVHIQKFRVSGLIHTENETQKGQMVKFIFL